MEGIRFGGNAVPVSGGCRGPVMRHLSPVRPGFNGETTSKQRCTVRCDTGHILEGEERDAALCQSLDCPLLVAQRKRERKTGRQRKGPAGILSCCPGGSSDRGGSCAAPCIPVSLLKITSMAHGSSGIAFPSSISSLLSLDYPSLSYPINTKEGGQQTTFGSAMSLR